MLKLRLIIRCQHLSSLFAVGLYSSSLSYRPSCSRSLYLSLFSNVYVVSSLYFLSSFVPLSLLLAFFLTCFPLLCNSIKKIICLFLNMNFCLYFNLFFYFFCFFLVFFAHFYWTIKSLLISFSTWWWFSLVSYLYTATLLPRYLYLFGRLIGYNYLHLALLDWDSH